MKRIDDRWIRILRFPDKYLFLPLYTHHPSPITQQAAAEKKAAEAEAKAEAEREKAGEAEADARAAEAKEAKVRKSS